MSETKHTPGPWYYTNEGLNAMAIVEKDGTNIMHMATLQNSTASRHMEANARLIAAAPDLLEALEMLYAVVQGECPSLLDEDSGGDSRLDIAIAAAIAKAKGEQP